MYSFIALYILSFVPGKKDHELNESLYILVLFCSYSVFFLSFMLLNIVPACCSFTIFSRNLLRIFNLYCDVVMNFGEQL
jgi:hypothetical protein